MHSRASFLTVSRRIFSLRPYKTAARSRKSRYPIGAYGFFPFIKISQLRCVATQQVFQKFKFRQCQLIKFVKTVVPQDTVSAMFRRGLSFLSSCFSPRTEVLYAHMPLFPKIMKCKAHGTNGLIGFIRGIVFNS